MILFLCFVFNYEYYIKIPRTELYLQTSTGPTSPMFLGEKRTRNRFSVEFAKGSDKLRHIHFKDIPNRVLDYVYSSKKIISYPFFGTTNQKFEIRLYNCINRFYIVADNKCLTYEKEGGVLTFEKCSHDNQAQCFEFVCANCNKRNEKVEHEDNKEVLMEGFYNEEIMSVLHKIKAMVHEMTDCFVNNDICKDFAREKPEYCVSPFDPMPKQLLDSPYDVLANGKRIYSSLRHDNGNENGLHKQNYEESATNHNNNNQAFNAAGEKLQVAIDAYKQKLIELEKSLKITQSSEDQIKNSVSNQHPIHLEHSSHSFMNDFLENNKLLDNFNSLHNPKEHDNVNDDKDNKSKQDVMPIHKDENHKIITNEHLPAKKIDTDEDQKDDNKKKTDLQKDESHDALKELGLALKDKIKELSEKLPHKAHEDIPVAISNLIDKNSEDIEKDSSWSLLSYLKEKGKQAIEVAKKIPETAQKLKDSAKDTVENTKNSINNLFGQ